MTARLPLTLVTGGSPDPKLQELLAADTLDIAAVGLTGGVVAGTTQTQTLTNKTLTAPKVDEIHGASSATPVMKFIDTASAANYIVTQNQAAGNPCRIATTGTDADVNLTLYPKGAGVVKVRNDSDATLREVVSVDKAQTLSNKTLAVPIIADFTSANHNHSNAAGGGTLDAAAIASGLLATARLPAVVASDYTQTGVGFYYYVGHSSAVQSLSTYGPTLKVFYCFPFFAPHRAAPVADQIAFEVTTPQAASNAKLAIYNNTSSVSVKPSTLFLDCGSVSCAVGTAVSASVTANLVAGSLYWLAIITDTAGIVVRSSAGGGSMLSVLGATGTFGATVQSNVGMSLAAYDAGNEYTNFPTASAPAVVAATLATFGSVPLIGLRYSS